MLKHLVLWVTGLTMGLFIAVSCGKTPPVFTVACDNGNVSIEVKLLPEVKVSVDEAKRTIQAACETIKQFK